MSQYEDIREEFHRLQEKGSLLETRTDAVEIVNNGMVFAGHTLPHGLNGVCTYRRKDNTLICEEAFLGGAVDGYARYYNTSGELVGEDYYQQGGVTQTRVFK